jgi:PAS domain S-box-containing protein
VVSSIKAALVSASNRWCSEYRFQRGDGSYATVLDRGQIMHNAQGVPVRMIGGLMDLSGHLAAEDQIAEQATLLDQATDAIIVRDLQHRIVYWNQGAEKIYGWTRAEALMLSVADFQAEQAKFQIAMDQVMTNGNWSGELEQVDKHGNVKHMQCRWTLLRNRREEPKSILAINTDITEKKLLEAQFLRAQRMESIGALAGGIAHDLNNVLTPIIMGMDLLRLHSREPAAVGVIDMVEATAMRGAEMIGQVLAFARGVDGQRHAIKLPQIAREVSRILKDTLPRNIRLHLTGDQLVPPILGDATQIHQVLMNLCVNARDAMPQGGEITIAIDQAPAWPKPHPDDLTGACVSLVVTDTGTGIPAAVQARIFEPFFTTKEVGKGTGLGLATVLAIVRSHHGMLELVSAAGQGTSFIMWFPAAAPTAASLADAAPVPTKPPGGNGETILVVDDEESLRRMTAQTLEAFGYRTLTATDGADAIRIYAQHQREIAVVLTDMMMPVMDGPAAVQALLALDPRVKIIAATGLAQDENLCLMQGMGVTHFLPKPFPTATMLKLIHELIHAPT